MSANTKRVYCVIFIGQYMDIGKIFWAIDRDTTDAYIAQSSLQIHFTWYNDGNVAAQTIAEGPVVHVLVHKHVRAAGQSMVGGELCNGPRECLIQLLRHEYVHVLIYAMRWEQNIPDHVWVNEETHGPLFRRWLYELFGQRTPENGLLLPNHFETPMQEWFPGEKARLLMGHDWVTVTIVRQQEEDYSLVEDPQGQQFRVHNGLLFA